MPKINSLVFLDFETGGTDATKHAVTEIAAVAIKLDTLEKIDLISEFIKPYGEYGYSDEALKVTGITMDDINGGIDIKEAVKMMIELLKKADLYPSKGALRPIIVAHNSAFDKQFLIQIFSFCKKLAELEKYTYGDKDFYGNYQPECLDTIIISKLMFGHDEDMTKHNLPSFLTKLGIELNDAHRAINDTLALKDGGCAVIRKMRSDSSAEGGTITKGKIRDHWQM